MVHTAEMMAKRTNDQIPTITFDQSNLEDVCCPYDDALIVTLNIDGNEIDISGEKLLLTKGPIKGVIRALVYSFAKVH